MIKEKTYNGPQYKLGKLINKYVIIEILAFTHENYLDICNYLFSCSGCFRHLLATTYNDLKFMLVETHKVTLERTLHFTRNHKTSRSAHAMLERILNIECKNAQITNYGLTMKPGVELKIANTEEAAFLLQSELHSIYRGIVYVSEKKGVWRDLPYTIRGYFDQYNNLDGPAIVLFDDGVTWLVDYTKSNTHYIIKEKYQNGDFYWGQYSSNDKRDGFGLYKWADGASHIG